MDHYDSDMAALLKKAFESQPEFDLEPERKALIIGCAKRARRKAALRRAAPPALACAACLALCAVLRPEHTHASGSDFACEFAYREGYDIEISSKGRTTVFQNASAEIICLKSPDFKFDRHCEEAYARNAVIRRRICSDARYMASYGRTRIQESCRPEF